MNIFKVLCFAAFAVTSSVSWADETPGVKMLKRLEPVPARGIKFANVIEVDPSLVHIKAVSAKSVAGSSRMTISRFMDKRADAIAAINSSFFDPGTGKIVGFFMEDGNETDYIPEPEIDWVFYIKYDGTINVAESYKLTPDQQVGVESATAGKSSWNIAPDRTARTATCLTKDGKLKLITAYPVATLEAMKNYIKEDEGCVTFIHFDGGGSSQIAYRPGGLVLGWERHSECYQEYDVSPNNCFRPVTAFLAVFPKENK